MHLKVVVFISFLIFPITAFAEDSANSSFWLRKLINACVGFSGDQTNSFIDRFPQAAENPLNIEVGELWKQFFEQIKGKDLSVEPLSILLYSYAAVDLRFDGWVSRLVLKRADSPRHLVLSKVLVDGWRRLGYLDKQNKFNFRARPESVVRAFEQITELKTRTSTSKRNGRDQRLLSHLDYVSLLADGIVDLSDIHDFLFHLPILTDPRYRELILLIARHDKILRIGRSSASLLSRVLEQNYYQDPAELYGPIPLFSFGAASLNAEELAIVLSTTNYFHSYEARSHFYEQRRRLLGSDISFDVDKFPIFSELDWPLVIHVLKHDLEIALKDMWFAKEILQIEGLLRDLTAFQ